MDCQDLARANAQMALTVGCRCDGYDTPSSPQRKVKRPLHPLFANVHPGSAWDKAPNRPECSQRTKHNSRMTTTSVAAATQHDQVRSTNAHLMLNAINLVSSFELPPLLGRSVRQYHLVPQGGGNEQVI